MSLKITMRLISDKTRTVLPVRVLSGINAFCFVSAEAAKLLRRGISVFQTGTYNKHFRAYPVHRRSHLRGMQTGTATYFLSAPLNRWSTQRIHQWQAWDFSFVLRVSILLTIKY